MFPPGGFIDRFGDPQILHQHHHQINILMYPILFPIIFFYKKYIYIYIPSSISCAN